MLNKKFPRLLPEPIGRNMRVADLIETTFKAYNGGRLAEGCRLLTEKMLPANGCVGMTLTGALTPAGLGRAAVAPLMKAGFVDWIVSTGANLYHDLHYGLGMELYAGSPFLNDVDLRHDGVIRIYDILFDYSVLLDTDAFVRQVIQGAEFQKTMGTDEFHYLLGKYVYERERKLGLKDTSVLSAAYQYGVPIFTSSPGDSSIGMNVAAMALRDSKLQFDVNRDVNQTAAIVYEAKSGGLTSSVFILGGGSPKNFILQTEPQIQEVMGIEERGHDYFLQCTDARPDTGGLSGATPAEAVSWGKIDPDNLPDCVVCYTDSTIALPLITAYALSKHAARPRKRLYDMRDAMLERLRAQYLKRGTVEKIEHRTDFEEESAAAHRADGGDVAEGEAMTVLKPRDPNYKTTLAALNRSAEPDPRVSETVAKIIADIRKRGDAALIEFTEKFDGPRLTAKQLRVSAAEFKAAEKRIEGKTREAVAVSHTNVREFAEKSLRKSWSGKNRQGAKVGERFDPFQRVGIYVPGGTAPLVSTAVMTCTLAAAAGVPEIVVTTPADKSGAVNPALLHALRVAGATEVYKVGGAQAVAALAYGTESLAHVLKIFGPGNAYVVEAKRQCFGRVAVDLLPGPSEILVIADATANAAWIASDLLAQAEHGHGSAVLFVTDSAKMLKEVEAAFKAQLAKLARQEHLREVADKTTHLILVKNLGEAVKLANDFAPEHLTIVAKDDEKLAAQIRTAGAIFLGGYSPVVAGDFVAGPSHELPTGGAGKSFPGLTVDQFQRRTSVVRLDRKSLGALLPAIRTFSEIEGLDAHGNSAAIRFE